jgi:hypothetical protein
MHPHIPPDVAIPFSKRLRTGDADVLLGGRRELACLGGQVPAVRRGVNSSQVADPWISPLTILHPPNASGGNMYLHRSQRISDVGEGR